MVLLIPSVLALLGDNPMQSELSCHVGMNGKHFCRVCLVCNPSVVDEEDDTSQCNGQHDTPLESDVDSAAASEAMSDVISEANSAQANARRRKGNRKSNSTGAKSVTATAASFPGRKKKESLAQLIAQARDFLTVSASINLLHKSI